jgi:hypothetical protein
MGCDRVDGGDTNDVAEVGGICPGWSAIRNPRRFPSDFVAALGPVKTCYRRTYVCRYQRAWPLPCTSVCRVQLPGSEPLGLAF